MRSEGATTGIESQKDNLEKQCLNNLSRKEARQSNYWFVTSPTVWRRSNSAPQSRTISVPCLYFCVPSSTNTHFGRQTFSWRPNTAYTQKSGAEKKDNLKRLKRRHRQTFKSFTRRRFVIWGSKWDRQTQRRQSCRPTNSVAVNYFLFGVVKLFWFLDSVIVI